MFVRPRSEVYKPVLQQVHATFPRYTPLIQPLSLDEAYLNVTRPLLDRGSAIAIAGEIKAAIRAETGLTASAGVSYNKFLAKLASDYRKPDGLFVTTSRMGPAFVETLPVGKFHSIGPKTAARMTALGIHTGLDLRVQPLACLAEHFGKSGDYLYGVARGVDDRPVQADRVRRSVGAEREAFEHAIDKVDADVKNWIRRLPTILGRDVIATTIPEADVNTDGQPWRPRAYATPSAYDMLNWVVSVARTLQYSFNASWSRADVMACMV